ncbi:MAG: glycosyltransferase family 4 protein [Bdellovibrionales bacterium]|nr:glycosyltransferase family 4 protein [Bdellovibrionales bacterium]
MRKGVIPKSLNICLVGTRFQILSRKSDHGFLWSIARGLARRGHQVTVLSTTSSLARSEVVRDGVRTFYLEEGLQFRGKSYFSDLALRKFRELHKEKPFHILHGLDNSAYKIAKTKDELHLAVAYDVEATQMSQLFSILGMGQETLTSLLTTGLAVTYKFVTTFFAVPYGIEIGDLSPKEKSAELKATLGLPENSHIAVTISDMTELHELKNILLSFEKVAIKKPNAYLIVVGNGPLFKQIEFEVLNLALGNRVILTGAQKSQDILDYVLLGDLFINLRSRTTGFEPSMIEAMAQKKVIIGSEVSPIGHIIDDGVDGFLLRPADIESLAQLMLEIFSGTIAVAEIGERARKKVVDLFDTQKMIASILEAYQKILLKTGFYRVPGAQIEASEAPR